MTDHEIFRLRDEIKAYEGPDVTFYGRIWLSLPSVRSSLLTRVFSRFLRRQIQRKPRRYCQGLPAKIEAPPSGQGQTGLDRQAIEGLRS
jgi:hypothetical protein